MIVYRPQPSFGSLTPGEFWPNPTKVDLEDASFDARLNAWLVEYQSAYASLPDSLTQQIDDFIDRWRDRGTFWVFSSRHADVVLQAEADFNRFQDQVAHYTGQTSAIAPATATTSDGHEVRADQMPPGSDTLSRITTVLKWGGVALASAAAFKIASDLGLIARLARLVGGKKGAT